MSSSEQRNAANRANAQKSTGPRSDQGKAVACFNASRHGLFSARLLLDDEEPAEFQKLLADLDATLHPVGTVEQALVERVAVTVWRQRRLVAAETAALQLTRQPRKLARGVFDELGLDYSAKLKEEDLTPFDAVQAEWCQRAVDEIEALEEINFEIDLNRLPKAAPLVFAQLKSDAEEENEDIDAHLKNHENGLADYLAGLGSWCRDELQVAEKRPHILALADQLRARHLVLPSETLELLTRYQTTLDNQFYKALRAFREAQEWRLKTLDLPGPQTDAAA
jgi:hypothetical protein